MAQQKKPEYDAQTMAFIQSAQMIIAKNHGLELDRDPAEIMRENNNKLHDAATAIKKRKGMVRQSVPSNVPAPNIAPAPQQVQMPVPKKNSANDEAMHQNGYDAYMQGLMRSAPEEEYDDADTQDEVETTEE